MKKVWDRAGIAFSSVCVLHCVGVAFLPLLFPAIAQYTHSSWVHILAGILILITSPLAFVPGYRKHGINSILAVAVSGISLVMLGILLEDAVSDQISHGVSICGSLLLVGAHVKNLQHSRRHHHRCC